ncbi:hypothetical protein NL676_003417 [Syzygium grande]|nr:hypothetical protein NL676_003417 [Syzygium grande]
MFQRCPTLFICAKKWQVILTIFTSLHRHTFFLSRSDLSPEKWGEGNHDMDRTVVKYRDELGLPQSSHSQGCRSIEFWRAEIHELTRGIETMETQLKHLSGEDLSMLSMKELRQLERQLKTGVERIHSKKRRIISEHANLLKRNLRVLQEENARLLKTVKYHEMRDVGVRPGVFVDHFCNSDQRVPQDGSSYIVNGGH